MINNVFLPMMVFLLFSLMTRGVPLSKAPGNRTPDPEISTVFDFVISPLKENSDS